MVALRCKKNSFSFLLILAAPLVFTLIGCDDGGECDYDEFAGTCTITNWQDAVDSGYSCTADTVEVTFDFVPTQSDGESVTGREYMVGSGTIYNPPRAWLESVGLTVGTSHDCTRSWATSGSCTPEMFSFNDIDEESFNDYCD